MDQILGRDSARFAAVTLAAALFGAAAASGVVMVGASFFLHSSCGLTELGARPGTAADFSRPAAQPPSAGDPV